MTQRLTNSWSISHYRHPIPYDQGIGMTETEAAL